jgi:hypothetical protein
MEDPDTARLTPTWPRGPISARASAMSAPRSSAETSTGVRVSPSTKKMGTSCLTAATAQMPSACASSAVAVSWALLAVNRPRWNSATTSGSARYRNIAVTGRPTKSERRIPYANVLPSSRRSPCAPSFASDGIAAACSAITKIP